MPDIARNRIEIWRNEVESQTSSQSGGTIDVGWSAPVVRQPSFWRRIFGLANGGIASGNGSGSGSGSGSGRSRSIGRKIGLVKEDIERTGMYNVRSRSKDEVGSRGLEGRRASRGKDGGSSMEIDDGEETGRDGLMRKKNRLERASKLLGKNEGMRGNGRRS